MTELVERVDDQDRVLGVVARDDAVRCGWLHRIATTVCRDELGRFLVYRRAEGLSRYPGYYEVAFGGAVDVGESYQAAAARELAEELGVDVPVREVVTFLCRGEIGSYWLGVYEAVIVGDVSPDPKAVSWVGWLTSAELSEVVGRHRFIPDGQEALRRYLQARAASPGSVQ
ncbi:NUDIX domain-containing protein [Nonomuraea sp. NPDC005650]|uniref:NUDIX domain-containing protein n=1 Tax=Nonomuraea sp. NPDC005650 TaxID=3157045 RepID=UPI0033A21380